MQRSFDDLGTPLHQVTFCVFDLETTGTGPDSCAITEIGAVKVRGGECLGRFHTLVNPGLPIPPEITVLTGITQAMVLPAPRIAEVVPAFLEFAGDAVLVGHNVRFDLGFLRAAMRAEHYPPLANLWVDTLALARRLVREEVPNLRLGTLAERFRLSHRPAHRALDDALATTDLLHLLLERAGSLGVVGLDDLLALPTIKGHPQQAKLRLTSTLPRTPGVYLFRDRRGEVLYVGKAANLRQRVRSYFSGDSRRKIGQLIRETASIDHVVCAGRLEAAVLEVRLIHQHQPRFNRQAKLWGRYAYVKLTLDERFPRLAVARVAKPGDGCLYLGPLASAAAARRVIEAIQSASAIRRCTARIGRSAPRSGPCAPAQLGVAACPCSGELAESAYRPIVDGVVRGLTVEPGLLLEPLEGKMRALAAAERFEEAAEMRDRAAALAQALRRQRQLDALRRAGELEVHLPDGEAAHIQAGRLVHAWAGTGQNQARLDLGPRIADAGATPVEGPLPRHLVDEASCIARFLDEHAGRLRVLTCAGELALPLPRLPSYEPPKR